jgi:glycosyltransferase involved in cell wall biosynthesis
MERRLKRGFDAAVASDLPAVDAVVTMSESAKATLAAARRQGAAGVVYLVNSHPEWKNRWLWELGRLHAGHAELVPREQVDRIRRELAAADLVLVPTARVAEQLVAAGVDADRVAVEPYGTDVHSFAAEPRLGRVGSPWCLFVGQLCHRKGVSALLGAARTLPSVTFRLVGPVRNPALLRGLPANVEWLGPLDRGPLAAELAAADLFVLPSLEDAYPLASLEAMADGLPQVVSDHVGTAPLVRDAEAGLVVRAGNPDALAVAIHGLARDSERRIAMGQAARKAALAQPSWEDYARRVLARLGAGKALEARAS